jgi:Protein of unknown function (DUF3592)
MNEWWLGLSAEARESTLFAIVVVFTGVSWWRAWFQHRRLDRSVTWPSTPGRITSSRVELDDEGDPTAEIAYTYRVDGVDYTGDRVSFGDLRGESAREVVAHHWTGRYVAVSYDPDRRQDSVLQVTRGQGTWRLFVEPLFGLAVGAVLASKLLLGW